MSKRVVRWGSRQSHGSDLNETYSQRCIKLSKAFKFTAHKSTLSIVLLNIQSIQNKINELLIFLDSVKYPAIILLTEHWLRHDASLVVPGYLTVAKFSRLVHRHGGTAALVSEKLYHCFEFVEWNTADTLLVEKEFEFCIIYSKIRKLFILCLYRSPVTSVNSFLERLELLLLKLPVGSNVILTGDFNINFADTNSRDTIALSNLLSCFDLRMHVRQPTRVVGNSSTILDYFCSNTDEQMYTEVIDAGLSDHAAVVATMRCEAAVRERPRVRRRIMNAVSFSRFRQMCMDYNWSDLSNEQCIFEHFYFILCNMVDQSFPLRTIKIKHKSKPWITRGIRISASNLRFLNTLHKIFPENEFVSLTFTTYRRVYKRVILNAKRLYYSHRLANADNKQRETWAVVSELSNRRPKCSSRSDLDPDTFNNFFCSVAASIASGLPVGGDPLGFLSGISVSESFFLSPTSTQEIKETLTSMRKKDAAGSDGLSLRLLGELPDAAVDVLTGTINTSFSSGAFPDCLKNATVILLYKGGDANNPANFRPISLLSTLSKLIEHLVKSRVMVFLTRHGILSGRQFGFRPHTSTGDAMLSLIYPLLENINEGNASVAAFCDMSKAFDCVSHRIMLEKLFVYGFRGQTHDWFRSYLTGRSQSVLAKDKQSGSGVLSAGVPQGSVLGPILFLLYINDLALLDICGRVTMFADDVTILWRGSDSEALYNIVSRDLFELKKWCDTNQLALNFSKTRIMGFGCSVSPVVCGVETVPVVTQAKFLGLSMDCDLKFSSHIQLLCGRLASACHSIRVISRELGTPQARMSYFALIDSHLRYGLPFWGCCAGYNFQSVFVLQKRSIRYMHGVNSREHCRPLFIGGRILTLPCLFILETVCLIHKHRSMFPHRTSVVTTRHAGTIHLPIPHTTLVLNSIYYRGLKIYNHLPDDARNLRDMGLFRRRVSHWLVGKAFYSVEEFFATPFMSIA